MIPTFKDVRAARKRISSKIEYTPVMNSSYLDGLIGREVLFKCENLQKVGAFKARGALNALMLLDADISEVVTHSSGNHGAALGWAAGITDKKAFVICPTNASRMKREAIVNYGAQIIDCGPSLVNRESALQAFLQERAATFIHPYDNPEVIAGQGSAADEFLNDYPNIKEIWVPVGGGGLAAGTVIGADNRCKVVGCEPELARDAHDSLIEGMRMPPMPPVSIADGLLTSLGKLNFSILYQAGIEIQLVSEEEIRNATTLIWQELKVLIEPSAAVPVAAALKNKGRSKEPIGIILSGGNVEASLNV